MLALFLFACNGSDPVPTPTDDPSDDAGVPNLLVQETEVDFGVLADVGLTHNATVTVQNSGTGPLEVTSAAADGAFVSLSEGLTLEAQSIGQITLTFQPTEYVLEQTGTLTLVSNDPDFPELQVALFGGVILDSDGDGYDRPEAGGDDCDDSDDDIHPGATEKFYDGVDQDCAGDDDFDQDLDGFQTDAHGGTDCNDVVDSIYPGAPDSWYDGVDHDCAGNNDFDMDLDGYGSKAHNKGKDCDDDDDAAYPGAEERLNGKLDDCDGTRDWKVNPNTALVRVTGDGNNQYLGYSIAHGDYDSDGAVDTIVGGRNASSGVGSVYMVWGSEFPATADEDLPGLASESFNGSASNAYLGSALITLDEGDLAVGSMGASYNYGAIYWFDGDELAADFDDASAETVITGGSSRYYVGRGLGSSDLNGDGSDDLLFYYSSSTSSSSGQARIGLQYGGTFAGNVTASNVDSTWTTTSTNQATFESMSGGYDVDNDGYEDWIYCDPGYDGAATNAGAAWMIWGSSTDYANAETTLASVGEEVVSGEEASDATGTVCSLLPDLNGDGNAEYAVWSSAEGDLSIFFGGSSVKGGGSVVYNTADILVDMTDTNNPTVIRPTGDFNGDGTGDWVLGIDSTSSSDGHVYVFSGDMSAGTYEAGDAMAYVRTSTDDDNGYFGHAIPVHPGDVDNDGALDLSVGDWGYSGEINGDATTHSNTGAAYVFFGQ